MEDKRQRQKVGALPQWNSRFRFSAQKSSASDVQEGQQQRSTPGVLGPPRRVALAGAAGAAADRQRGDAGPKHPPQAGDTNPAEAEKTPTLCLFERFERLTLGTTPCTAPHSTAPGPGAANTQGSAGSAGKAASTVSSAGSEQFVMRGPRPGRRSVAFGTPSVLAYTPAQGPCGDQEEGADDSTPLWSNAGHTPYSLPGSSRCSPGLEHEQQQCEEYDAQEGGDESSCDTAAAGARLVITASRGRRGHSGLRMELFGGVVLQEVPEDEDSAASDAASCDSPTGLSAVTGRKGHSTPLQGASAAAAGVAAGGGLQELPGGADGADSSSAATAAGIEEDRGSECGDSAEVAAQLQTPPSWGARAAQPKYATPQAGAGAAATPGRPGSCRAAGAPGVSASKPARAAGGATRPAGSRVTPSSASRPAWGANTPKSAANKRAAARAATAGTPTRAAARTAGVEATPAAKSANAAAKTARPTPARSAKAAASKAAAAAASDAGSPSSGSAFTGFAGGATAGQQPGSTTPTFFDGSTTRRAVGSRQQAGSSQLQHLLGGRSPDSIASGSAATGSLGSTSSSKGTAAAATASSRKLGQASRIPTPPGSAQPSSRTEAAAGATPAFKAPNARVPGSAAATPATAPRQRTLCFDAAAGALQTPGPAAAAAAAAGASSSPVTGMRLPMTTPKSKLRQPERVAVEPGMPIRTELSKLLGDADAAAAAASVLGPAVAGFEGRADAVLGSCAVLSPVRARKQVQHALGAAEQVLTPVRRSARKVKGGSQLAAGPAAAAAVVQPMLEATNYCYQPNEALRQ